MLPSEYDSKYRAMRTISSAITWETAWFVARYSIQLSYGRVVWGNAAADAMPTWPECDKSPLKAAQYT